MKKTPVMLSQFPSDSEEEISVNFMSVSLSNTSWTIHGLNLLINNSNLEKVTFLISHKPICQICRRQIDIVNSTFGHMNIRSGYNIHVSDCTIDGKTVTPNTTLLDVVGGALSVSNSSFQYLSNRVHGFYIVPTILRAVGCRIHMVGVNCSNNEAVGGLIQVQNGSELFVQNSTFEHNGVRSDEYQSLIIAMNINSSLCITRSVFSGNSGLNGSCLWLDHNVSVTINQSAFVNNRAGYGGVIYQYYEAKNASGLNNSDKENNAARTQSAFSGEEDRHQSLSIRDSYFVNNQARSGGVVYLYGASTDLFVKKCNFTKNQATFYGSAIYAQNLTGNVMVQQCLFNVESLYLIGTHSQLMDCEFFCDPPMSSCLQGYYRTVNFQYGIASINNCTFNQFDVSISALGTKLNITDSRCYGEKKYCLHLDNSEITIVGSQFDTDAEVVLFNDHRSNLTVIDTSFVNGDFPNGDYVFKTYGGTARVEFINCLFHNRGSLALIGQTLLKNCTISNYQEPFIQSDFADPTFSAQLDIVDCVFIGNNVSSDQPFIYIENASFTMSNCLYTGNDARNHFFLNVTTDVTIKNVTFFNNSFGDNDDLTNENSLIIVNNTIMKMKNCNFESNNMKGGSLMLVLGSEVRVINTVMSDNYNKMPTHYTERKFFSTHDSKSVEFSSSKFINNSGINIFDVWSSNLLLIDNCLFENNDWFGYIDIWYTHDVILQRSRFNDIMAAPIQHVNNLRIFRCTCTPYGYNFFSKGTLKTKIFLLDSNVSVEGSDTRHILIDGSPYASGGY